MDPGKRARARADKQARRQDIVAAAGRLFDDAARFEKVTMAGVAREAGLAKGTVYLYFETKEALFLQLLLDELTAWFAGVTAALPPEDAPLDPQALGRSLAASLEARPRMLRLLTLLHGVLERNIDVQTALNFKRRLLAVGQLSGAALERRVPGMRPGDGVRFWLRLNAVAMGLIQSANPPWAVREALEQDPELARFQVDFAQELAAFVPAILAMSTR